MNACRNPSMLSFVAGNAKLELWLLLHMIIVLDDPTYAKDFKIVHLTSIGHLFRYFEEFNLHNAINHRLGLCYRC